MGRAVAHGLRRRAHLQARRIVRVEAQNACAPAASRRPAPRSGPPSRSLASQSAAGAASRARARSARPLGKLSARSLTLTSLCTHRVARLMKRGFLAALQRAAFKRCAGPWARTLLGVRASPGRHTHPEGQEERSPSAPAHSVAMWHWNSNPAPFPITPRMPLTNCSYMWRLLSGKMPFV